MDNIVSLFLANASKNSSRTVFHYFDNVWKGMTFGELSGCANALAVRLKAAGIVAGDRATIFAENRPEWAASYLAVLFRRAIAVPVDIQLAAAELRNVLLDSEARVLFCTDRTMAAAAEACAGEDIQLINLDNAAFSPVADYLPDTSADPEDIASIIYTSGTTGSPKGVMLTHRNFCSDAEAVIEAGIVREDDNVLSVLPLHHTYPFMCTFMMPVIYGATVTFSPGLKAAEIVDAIKAGGVTVVLGVPRLFEMILNGITGKMRDKRYAAPLLLGLMNLCGRFRSLTGLNAGRLLFGFIHKNFGSTRFFASGGARLDPSIMSGLEALGFTVVEGYGLTETSPILTFNPLSCRKPGSVGKALSCAELRIHEGEIAARGPMLMKGYYRNEAATAEVIRDGWFYTGDLGRIDEDGYLFITGRKKEVIVLGSGKNIYPEDVEKAYARISLIKEIGITGYERNGKTEGIQAIIVPDLDYAKKSGVGNIADTMKWEISQISSELPEYMRVRGFQLSNEPLPRTPLGKLRRFMLKDLLAGSSDTRKREQQSDPLLMNDESGSRLVHCIQTVLNEKVAVKASDNLELDLGLDSLGKVELITAIEDAFGMSLPDTFIADVQTVADALELIRSHTSSGASNASAPLSWREILNRLPSEEDRNGMVYEFGRVERLFIIPVYALMRLACRLYFRLTVKGTEHLPKDRPYIIASNHASYIDGFAMAGALPFSVFEKLYFLGLSKFFAGSIKQYMARVAHVIPIDAEAYLNRALQISSYVLTRGRSLCIFPEGGRSFSKEVMEFKKGVGIIAVELGIPVVPVHMSGTLAAMPRGKVFIRPAKIEVVFGRPLCAADIDFSSMPPGRDRYQYFADQLREHVIELG